MPSACSSPLPALSLAVAGLFHPHSLGADTAQRWFGLHVAGLLVFPLVGVALAALVRGRRDPVAWVVRLAAYVYATFYTALDVVSGMAAGYVTRELGPGVPRPDEVRLLFRIGTPIGEVGSWALLVCVVVLVVDLLVRHRVTALPALLLVPGAWLVHTDHIFSPLGVAGMALIGVGCGALVAARPELVAVQVQPSAYVARHSG
ncbi:hypothetical protein [Nocardioides sp.]|uniref:hypothetical protein n=1 Tax=Nocardioides sp. TaxID=35761 RepID=UPI00286C7ECF|nr:hypothetical protein [Nocardioides sp.]